MILMMMMMMMMMMMTKSYDYDDVTDDVIDDGEHENDNFAAGAAPGASVPCSLFWFRWSRPFVPGSLVRAPWSWSPRSQGPRKTEAGTRNKER